VGLPKEKVAELTLQALRDILSQQRGGVCLITPADIARHAQKRWRLYLYNHLKWIAETLASTHRISVNGTTWLRADANPWAPASRNSHLFYRADRVRLSA